MKSISVVTVYTVCVMMMMMMMMMMSSCWPSMYQYINYELPEDDMTVSKYGGRVW